jgi:cell division septum initiation protein DivIVA
MVDESLEDARPNDAGTAVRSSEYEARWRDGLSRLMTSLDTVLDRALQAARCQVSDAVEGIGRQGFDMLSTLDERQRESEEELRRKRLDAEREAEETVDAARRRSEELIAVAEARAAEIFAEVEDRDRASRAKQAAMQERVAQVQASVEAAEEELRRSQEDADRETQEMVQAARRRSGAIIARAESHADEIIAEAREEAASRRGVTGAARSGAAGGESDTPGGRLRGLSERLGVLLTSPVAAGAGVVAGAAAQAAGPVTVPWVDPGSDEAVEQEPEQPRPVEANQDAEPVAVPSGAVTQTLIFKAVPNFQAALSLERSVKAMSEVRDVRVADFHERQLTFQVTHELGAQLPRVLLTHRAGQLEFVEARPERVEFVFRS